jgi:hypothetical protein
MKPIIIFIATFASALAAATGVKVALTTQPPSANAAADSSTAADSAQAETAVVASGKPVTPPVDSCRPPARSDSSTAAPGSVTSLATAAVPALPTPPTVPTATRIIAGDTVAQAQERRLAKVFASMDAKQAAKVLEHMDDHDVQIILGYVGPRQAATIMAALPPARVAALSKLVMLAGTGGGKP